MTRSPCVLHTHVAFEPEAVHNSTVVGVHLYSNKLNKLSSVGRIKYRRTETISCCLVLVFNTRLTIRRQTIGLFTRVISYNVVLDMEVDQHVDRRWK